MDESKLAKEQATKAEKALATQTAAAKSVSPAVKKAEKEPELYVKSSEQNICTCLAKNHKGVVHEALTSKIRELAAKRCKDDCKGKDLEDLDAEIATLEKTKRWFQGIGECK